MVIKDLMRPLALAALGLLALRRRRRLAQPLLETA
jgi:hypothetical protein